MPIKRKEYDEGEILSELEKKIVTFLEENKSQSFLPNEIMDGVKMEADYSSFGLSILSVLSILNFGSVLDGLVVKRKIEKKCIVDYHLGLRDSPLVHLTLHALTNEL